MQRKSMHVLALALTYLQTTSSVHVDLAFKRYLHDANANAGTYLLTSSRFRVKDRIS